MLILFATTPWDEFGQEVNNISQEALPKPEITQEVDDKLDISQEVHSKLDISQEALARIKVGMRKAEVETILGGRAGDYSSQPVDIYDVPRKLGYQSKGVWWIGDKYAIAIRFSNDGKVVIKLL